MSVPQMTVTIESRMDCVSLAGTLVRRFCEASGATRLESAEIELCIVEAANNSIQHSCAGEHGHSIEVFACRCDNGFVFEVRDQGVAIYTMDTEERKRDQAELPEGDEYDANAFPERASGLAIVETVMDRVQYVATPRLNRLIMTKGLPVYDGSR